MRNDVLFGLCENNSCFLLCKCLELFNTKPCKKNILYKIPIQNKNLLGFPRALAVLAANGSSGPSKTSVFFCSDWTEKGGTSLGLLFGENIGRLWKYWVFCDIYRFSFDLRDVQRKLLLNYFWFLFSAFYLITEKC